MAKIKPVSIVAGISGKLNKDEVLTFYTHKNGKIFAHENRAAGDQTPSETQRAIHEKFAAVQNLVATDMAESGAKELWQEIADKSNGKYQTARGACFAHHWANYDPAPQA